MTTLSKELHPDKYVQCISELRNNKTNTLKIKDRFNIRTTKEIDGFEEDTSDSEDEHELHDNEDVKRTKTIDENVNEITSMMKRSRIRYNAITSVDEELEDLLDEYEDIDLSALDDDVFDEDEEFVLQNTTLVPQSKQNAEHDTKTTIKRKKQCRIQDGEQSPIKRTKIETKIVHEFVFDAKSLTSFNKITTNDAENLVLIYSGPSFLKWRQNKQQNRPTRKVSIRKEVKIKDIAHSKRTNDDEINNLVTMLNKLSLTTVQHRNNV